VGQPPVVQIPVESINLTSNTNEITTEEFAIISINKNPYNATYESIKWYVNDVVVQGQTGTSYTFSSNTTGTFVIKAEMDGVMCPTRTITVIAAELTKPESNDEVDVVVIVTAAAGALAVGGLGTFGFIKLRKIKKLKIK